MVDLIVFIILITLIVLLGFVAYRNFWVFNARDKILRNNPTLEEYYNLLTYNQVMVRFWIWDIKKLKRKKHDR